MGQSTSIPALAVPLGGSGEVKDYEMVKLEEGEVQPKPKVNDILKKGLSLFELLRVLRPFFWPNAGSDGALINRCLPYFCLKR